MASGGMNRAQTSCHNGVNGRASCHHCRQRCSVRRGTPSSPASHAAAGICPACRADASTTARDRYTRRPRKRTDIEVVRRRQRLQQKLNRVEKSSRTSLGQARGLRGKSARCRVPPHPQPAARASLASSTSICRRMHRNLGSSRRAWHTWKVSRRRNQRLPQRVHLFKVPEGGHPSTITLLDHPGSKCHLGR